MKVKVELHTHTNYSHDSLLSKWLYLVMLKLRKIDVVGITDHNEIEGAKKIKSFLNKYGIKVIVGEEVFSERGEIIGLFIEKKILPGLSPRETMLQIKEQGGVVYIPHPYDEKRYKTVLPEEDIKKNSDLIDIIEIHNGRNIKSLFSDKQLEIGKKYNKIMCVGSDAHTFIELGRNYNIMDEFNDSFDFLNKLKESKSIQRDCLQVCHQLTKIDRIIKLLGKGQFNELFRVIYKRYRKRNHKAC
ncbi:MULTISPECIES: PHP domain-containing protein [Priestia]|uniref:PHP domain-containing protein n=1 Tax=Priestia TaxID=2800373 RepID=UPI002E23F714|nr:PHP domain-containing protein [Priestia aryabhattai]MED4023439.1 PHP domain-containing protein [Priestia aryabhattai]